MKIYSVFEPEFHAYGQIVDGMEDTIAALLEALAKTPQGEAVAYVPEEPLLQNLPEGLVVATALRAEGFSAKRSWLCGAGRWHWPPD